MQTETTKSGFGIKIVAIRTAEAIKIRKSQNNLKYTLIKQLFPYLDLQQFSL